MPRCLPALWLLSFAGFAVAADDWPQFRGPGGQGHSRATGLPLTWSETENVAWKVPVMGRGWSSPVVWGDQIWMTTAVRQLATPEEASRRLAGKHMAGSLEVARHVTLWAVCVDRRSGRQQQKVRLFEVDRPDPVHRVNTYASPTPALEPGRLYCDFGTFGTACVDTATGKVLWTRRLPIDHQVGPGSSPLVCDDLLVLVRDGRDRQYVTAVDKKTGRTVWKTDRPPIDTRIGDYRKAFSTPLVIEADGSRQLIVPGAQWVVSYEPATGRPIWRADYNRGFSVTPRPVFAQGMVYICTGYSRPELWAIRVDGRGDVTNSHVLWKCSKQVPIQPSPLIVGDELYVVSDGGVATCFDAKTGRMHWRERVGGEYSASPICADGRIYLFSRDGKTSVLRPGKQFQRLAENQVDGRLMATPAVAASAIFLRSETHLYRIQQRPSRSASNPSCPAVEQQLDHRQAGIYTGIGQ